MQTTVCRKPFVFRTPEPDRGDPTAQPNDQLLYTTVCAGRADIVQQLLGTLGLHRLAGPGYALAVAAGRGDLDCVRLLLDAGVDIEDTRNGYWGTPLMAAVSHRHCPMVQYLVARGADVTNKGHEPRTPIELARELGCHDITAILQARELEAALGAVSVGASADPLAGCFSSMALHTSESQRVTPECVPFVFRAATDPLAGCFSSMSLHASESQRVVPDCAPSTFNASADPLAGSAFHPSDPRRVMG